MRKLKIYLCLLLALAMLQLCSTNSAFAKNSSDTEYKYGVLCALGFFGGDSSFAKDFGRTMSRGELAAAITSAIPFGEYKFEENGGFEFDDVPPEDIYASGIYKAAELGLIKKSKLFYPNRDATVEEAFYMTLRLLGYGYQLEMRGECGKIAAATGLSAAVGQSSASRLTVGTCVKLFYKLLDCKTLAQTETKNGVFTKEGESFLKEVLRTEKRSGILRATHLNGRLDSSSAVTGENEILIGDEEYFCDRYDAENYLGRSVEIYARDDGDGFTVLYMDKKAVNDELVLPASDILSFESGVYSYSDKNNRRQTADIRKSADVLYNGKAVTKKPAGFVPKYGNVTLIDNNGDSVYEVVMINDVSISRVQRVDNVNYMIYTSRSGEVISLYDGGKVDYIIKDKLGNRGDIRSLAAGTVISAAVSEDKKLVHIYYSNDKFDGTITGIDRDNEELTVDGKLFGYTETEDTDFAISDYGTFYTDACGSVCFFDKTSIGRTGYLIKAAAKRGLSGDTQMRILSSDGKIDIYNASDKLRINGSANFTSADEIIAELEKSGRGDAAQIINYRLNSDGEISRIETAADYSKEIQTGERKFHRAVLPKTTYTYKSWAANFGSAVRANAETTVFVIPEDRSSFEKYKVYENGAEYFVNGIDYTIDAYAYDYDTAYASVIAVYTGADGDAVEIAPETPIMIVDKLSGVKTEDGFSETQVSGLCGGRRTSFIMPDEARFNRIAVGRGDIIRYAVNDENRATAVDKLFDYKRGAMTTANPSTDDYIAQRRYLYGGVYSAANDLARISVKSFAGVKNTDDLENAFTDRFIYVYKYSASAKTAVLASQNDIKDFGYYPEDYSKVFVYNWYGDPNTLVIYE